MKGVRNVQRKDISSLLLKLGVSPSHQGFDYIIECVKMVDKNKELIYSVTTKLFPEVAEKFKTTPERVGRNIRHAIQNSLGYVDDSVAAEVFGSLYSKNRGIKNSCYIGAIAEYLREGD